MIGVLLKNGANPDAQTRTQRDAPPVVSKDEGWKHRVGGVPGPEIAALRRNTPLQVASRQGHKKIAEMLIAHGANINEPAARNTGATALQYAAMNGCMGIAYLLLENGAEVNAPPAEIDGRTALEVTAEHGRIDMVQLLLNYGAEIYGDGQFQYERSLMFATRNGHHALREMLEDRHPYAISLGGISQLCLCGT